MKIKILLLIIIGAFISLLFSLPLNKVSASQTPSVELLRLTFGFYREDWPVIDHQTVCWIGNLSVDCYDFDSRTYTSLFESGQTPANMFGLVGYDGRYLVYNRYTDQDTYDVSVYDLENQEEIQVTSLPGSQWADDYDKETLTYIDGGVCGTLYTYNLQKRNTKFITSVNLTTGEVFEVQEQGPQQNGDVYAARISK